MNVAIRLLQAHELAEAEQIFRLAFGTFIGLPDPTEFAGDASYIPHRWRTEPTAASAAAVNERLVGSNLATHWGSVGFFGPLSVHPDFWNQKIAQGLIEAVLERFEQWNIQQAGLFTFANSPIHHALYQKFGFYPRFLTFIMEKPVSSEVRLDGSRFSQLDAGKRIECLDASRELTQMLYEGLDVSTTISTVQAQQLGDTVLLFDQVGLAGFAVCHYGAGTEAGSNTCCIKFGAVRPSANAGQHFEQLLDLCESLSVAQGMSRLVAGVNTSHDEAYRRMVARGFRTEITGVAMHRPNQPGYHHPDVFVLDDWR